MKTYKLPEQDAKCMRCGSVNSCAVCCSIAVDVVAATPVEPCTTCGQLGTHHRDCAKMKCCQF